MITDFINICQIAKIVPNLWQTQNLVYESYQKFKSNQDIIYKIKSTSDKLLDELNYRFSILADLLYLKIL